MPLPDFYANWRKEVTPEMCESFGMSFEKFELYMSQISEMIHNENFFDPSGEIHISPYLAYIGDLFNDGKDMGLEHYENLFGYLMKYLDMCMENKYPSVSERKQKMYVIRPLVFKAGSLTPLTFGSCARPFGYFKIKYSDLNNRYAALFYKGDNEESYNHTHFEKFSEAEKWCNDELQKMLLESGLIQQATAY